MTRVTWGAIAIGIAVAAIVFATATLCDLDAARWPAGISVVACIAWGLLEPRR